MIPCVAKLGVRYDETQQGDNVAFLSSLLLCPGKDTKTVPRRYLSFLIFEYFQLINEASYLVCDSLSYIFQHLNNSHFTWPVRGNAIWSNFKRQLLRISLPSFKDV